MAKLTIGEIAALIKSGEISPLQLTQTILDRVERLDKRINSYITVLKDEALKAARTAEDEVLSGRYLGPLHGIPIGVKDIFETEGIRTTCGSKILADYVPRTDATVIRRLKEAGAIIVGKLNMHEFAFGVTSENPHYGPVRNPWDPERIAGGSSGGSAAAVAASLCMASLGTDTGGSVRIPAALCGTVGLKPTYGRVSRHGVIPLSWTQDHVGILSKSVTDAALILRTIAGYDPLDATTSRRPVPDYAKALTDDVRGVRVGVVKELLMETIEAEVKEAISKALGVLEELGTSVSEISLPHIRYARSVNLVIIACEAASYHEKYLRTRAEDYGEDVRARLELGRFLLAGHYIKAQRLRSLLNREMLERFRQVDVLVAPTTPITAPKIGEPDVWIDGELHDARTLLPRNTGPFNLAGLPSISIPCGYTSRKLPVGMQIVGKPFDESTILKVAYAYELNSRRHAIPL